MYKKWQCFNIFLILGFIFDHNFCPKKDSFSALCLFSTNVWPVPPVILCYICRVAEWRIKHFRNISRYNFIPLLKTVFTNSILLCLLAGSQFIFLKYNGLIWNLWRKFREKRIHLLRAFWGLIFKFFFKRDNHEKHP